MVVATWNINSIRSRLPRVIAWLRVVQPDVLCLQEIKTEQSLFPYPPFWALGYQVATWGERTYNGVAIVTRRPMTDVVFGLGDGQREEARLMAATIDGVRVVCAYVPHGQDKLGYDGGRERPWERRPGNVDCWRP